MTRLLPKGLFVDVWSYDFSKSELGVMRAKTSGELVDHVRAIGKEEWRTRSIHRGSKKLLCYGKLSMIRRRFRERERLCRCILTLWCRIRPVERSGAGAWPSEDRPSNVRMIPKDDWLLRKIQLMQRRPQWGGWHEDWTKLCLAKTRDTTPREWRCRRHREAWVLLLEAASLRKQTIMPFSTSQPFQHSRGLMVSFSELSLQPFPPGWGKLSTVYDRQEPPNTRIQQM